MLGFIKFERAMLKLQKGSRLVQENPAFLGSLAQREKGYRLMDEGKDYLRNNVKYVIGRVGGHDKAFDIYEGIFGFGEANVIFNKSGYHHSDY